MTTENTATVKNEQTLPPGMGARKPNNPAEGTAVKEPQLPQTPSIDPANHVLFGNDKGTTPEAAKPAPVAPELQVQKPPAPAVPSAPATVQDAFDDMRADVNTAPGSIYIENVCKQNGVDLGRAFSKALEKGDVSLVDEAYLREKCGDSADAVISQAKALFQYGQEKAQGSVNQMYGSLANGNVEQGKALLHQASKYFNQSAPKEEKAEIVYLLESGNPELMQRAAKRVVDFARSKGAVVQDNKAQLFQPSSERGLSAEEYKKAVANPKLSQADYEKLRQQRVLGKSQGL